MVVTKRNYRPYAGTMTPRPWRLLIPARYALHSLARSRALMGMAAAACVPLLVEASIIYLSHNPTARVVLGLMKLTELVRIDATFFLHALATQCFFGFVLAAWLGPNLVGGDLANGALQLFLSRPFSRIEYVAGKLIVVVSVGSLFTWVPMLLLYGINSALAGSGWWYQHLRIAFGLIGAGILWSCVVSLFVLSLSAWIRWRLLASAMLLGLYLVSAGFAEALVTSLGLPWGRLLNLGHVFRMIASQLLGAPRLDPLVPTYAAWLMLLLVGIASILVLQWRLRAREVVG